MNYDTSKSMLPDELAELLAAKPDLGIEQGTLDGAADYLQTDYMPEQPDSVTTTNASLPYGMKAPMSDRQFEWPSEEDDKDGRLIIPAQALKSAGQGKVRASRTKAASNDAVQEINTTIFMEPEGKARARTTTTKTGRVMAYTPAKTVLAENRIRNHLGDLLVRFDRNVPLRLEVTFWFRRPEHCPKKRLFPTVRPDWDNCAKLVCDAANRYIWEDDAQVVTAIVRKRYCLPGQVPRIDVRVSEEHAE